MEYTANYNTGAHIRQVKDVAEMASFLASGLQDLKSEINQNRKISLALSGGTTPFNIFTEWLKSGPFELFRNDILYFWGDERCVPPGNPESNYGNAFLRFLEPLHVPDDRIFRIEGENDPETEAKRYSGILKSLPISNGTPVIDLVLLGVGEDGHTASLFPDRPDLLVSENLVEASIHPQTGQNRITLTPRIINNAGMVVFVVSGRNKKSVLGSLFSAGRESKSLPAAFIKPKSGKLTWLIDQEASPFA